MAIYNFGNAVMSASGDTKKPLIYLTFAGVVNVCLNLILVIGIGMAEDGVAFASITAQYISAILVVVNLLRRSDTDRCRLRVRELKLYPGVPKVILMEFQQVSRMLYLLWLIYLSRQVLIHSVRLWCQEMPPPLMQICLYIML